MARSRMIGILVITALAVVSYSSPAGAVPTRGVNWRQFHGDPTHRGFNRFEQIVSEDNVFNLSLSWIGNGATFGADLVFKSSPVRVGGYVYFGTSEGQLLAFRDTCPGSQCDPAWRVDLPEAIYNTPAVVGGVLYVGTASPLGKLYAFDVRACAAGTCTPLWTGDVGVGESSPTVANGVVYVGSQFDGVYAFSAAGCGQSTCEPLWVGQTGGYVINSPAVANGVVYAGAEDNKLYAFDADGCGQATCSALWTGSVSGPIYASSPAVARGLVFVASFNDAPNSYLNVFPAAGCGQLVCQPLWKGTGGSFLNSSPAVAYGSVYIGSGDGMLLVYPAAGCGQSTCQPTWSGFACCAAMESAPMVANGVVYVGENNSKVYAFPAQGCGQQFCDPLWQFITQDPLVASSPAMVNGTLYVSGTNFSTVPELYVFELV